MHVNHRTMSICCRTDPWSKGWSAPSDENLCRRYRLTYMPLGVIGDMYQKARNGGGQILSADRAWLIQSIGLFAQLPNSSGTLGKGCRQLIQDFGVRAMRAGFGA